MTRAAPENAVKFAALLLNVIMVVLVLSWAKVVLIPVALAILLTFILSPVVTRLDHRGLGRVPAVLVVVSLAGLLLGSLAWLVASQLSSLASDLPKYQQNIRGKIMSLSQGTSGGALEKVQETFEEATRQAGEDLEKAVKTGKEQSSQAQEPVSVRIVPDEGAEKALFGAMASLVAISPALADLATAGFTLVLVLFMLIDREDLRNRLVSLTAEGSLATTTKALDDAGQRISRYLIMQLIINGTYGLAVGIGLLIIGVPYALLWGLCAAVFRYIPYIGPWVAALLPLTISLITSPGWTEVLFILALFLVLELLSNNIMEPWLYGHGIGVSVVALLVSAAFWTWIWGPIGLILATPLTVCLTVIGKYVPALAFLDRLLGDRPALQPHAAFLQRLLARDDEEAADIVQQYCTDYPPETVYDEVFVPALALTRQDRNRGSMSADEESFILAATKSILAEYSPEARSAAAGDDASGSLGADADSTGANGVNGRGATTPTTEGLSDFAEAGTEEFEGATSHADREGGSPPLIKLLGCAAHQEAEELTLDMLDQLTSPRGFRIEVLSTRTLPSDVVELVGREHPLAVIIAVLPPGGLVQARYLCKLIRRRFPEVWIVVGFWHYRGNLDRVLMKLRSAGAHYVTTTLIGAHDHVLSLAGTAGARPQPTRLARTNTHETSSP